jgi:hypothetical protein
MRNTKFFTPCLCRLATIHLALFKNHQAEHAHSACSVKYFGLWGIFILFQWQVFLKTGRSVKVIFGGMGIHLQVLQSIT